VPSVAGRWIIAVGVAVCVSGWLGSSYAAAQEWLRDQSYRGMPADLPTVPRPERTGGGQAEALNATAEPSTERGPLLEPPPPLADLPPSVFDQSVEEVEPVEESDAESYSPVWYSPWTWIPLDGWKNSAELGINGSDGNANSFSFQTGARFKRKTDLSQFDLRITLNQTRANGIETQNNALGLADYERFLGESRWTYFVKNGLEYDEFRAFDLRYNINSGLGYRLIGTDDLSLIGRFGAGASRKFGSTDDQWIPEALFGTDYEHQVNARNKLIAKIDYYPEWDNFSNFRLIGDVSWEFLLDEEGNLSLKMGANDRYDSSPDGRKPNDVNYSMLLLYKF
jgi:putative salt-induced outer membrane protein YdiY